MLKIYKARMMGSNEYESCVGACGSGRHLNSQSELDCTKDLFLVLMHLPQLWITQQQTSKMEFLDVFVRRQCGTH